MKYQISNIKYQIVLLLLLGFVLVAVPTVNAQVMEKEAISTVDGTEATATSGVETESAKVEYQLPYPGLLPDHPLYILKTIRDRIIDFLIADSLEEAKFTLTAADKRLAAAIALVDKGKVELAETTASKAEEYLARSIAATEKARQEGKDVLGITAKLKDSLNKHESVLVELATKTEGRAKDRFIEMAANAKKYRESLQSN